MSSTDAVLSSLRMEMARSLSAGASSSCTPSYENMGDEELLIAQNQVSIEGTEDRVETGQ